ncbi:MAG: GAF domain-containing protein, partial [Sideroxydans sp.]
MGIYENEPKIFTNAANEPNGIFIDLLEAIAKQHDWQLTYVKCEWTQCLNHLDDGSIDLMPDVAESAQRLATMDFHQTPALKSWSQLYRRFEAKIDSVTELEHKRVAVLKGSIQEAEFKNIIWSFGVAVELVSANTPLQVFELAKSGQADAAIANHYFGDFHAAEYDLEETSILFQPTKLYFATAKGRNKDLLSAIDQQLSTWQTNKNSEYFLVIKKWNSFAHRERLPAYIKEIFLFITLLLLMTVIITLVLRARLRSQKLGLIAANNQLKTTLDAMPDLLFEIDLHGRYLDYHSPRTELLAATPEELIGKTLHEVLPVDVVEVCMAEIHKANDTGSAKGGLITLDLPDGQHWFELSIAKKPPADGKLPSFIVMSRDITQRKVAEKKLARLTELYSALSECNQAIVRCNTMEELFPIICHDAVHFGGMKMAWIGILDEQSKLVKPVASFGSGIEYLEGLEISADPNVMKGLGPTGRALRENRPYWCQDFQHAPETSAWHERGAQFGWGASAALPILCKGKVFGAFTLYAGEVDSFDEAAKNLLVEMAMDISYALDRFADDAERMKNLNDLQSSQELVKMAGELAKIGAWKIDLPDMRLIWSDEVCMIHEMPIGTQPTLEQGINFYAPGYIDRIQEVVGKSISDGTPFDEELQIITATGKRIWVRTMGRAERNQNGQIFRVQGAFQDISELKEIEQRIHEKDVRYKLLFESLATGFALQEIICDEQGKPLDYRFLEINPAFETMTGLLVKNLIGHSASEVVPTLDRFWIERYGAVAISGEPVRFEYGVPELGKYFEVLAYSPARGQFATLFTDMTERKQAEASLALQAHRAEALLTLPLESERMTERDFMSYAVEIVEELTESSISFIHLVHEDQITIELGSWSRATQEQYCHAAYDNHYPIDKAGIWADALRQRRPIVINDYATVTNKHGLPEGHAHLERMISVPVLDGGLVRMMVGVGNKVGHYTDLDVETTQLMANTIWRIVQQRRAEFALQQSEEIFSHFMTNSPIYVFFKDEHIRALRLSKNYEQLVGKPMSEMLGKSMD